MTPISNPFPYAASTQNSASESLSAVSAVLDYLEHQLTGYQFDQRLDLPFVRELLDDFPDIDILEEIKAFRWYHDTEPLSAVKAQRNALRRWIARAGRPRYR